MRDTTDTDTDDTVGTFGYNCFGKGCTKEFDSLEEMEYIDGKGKRDGRHFCPDCADDILSNRSLQTNIGQDDESQLTEDEHR